MNLRDAVKRVDSLGACLVFPQDNRSEPMSLWKAFYPRSVMRWDWDQGGDTRVHDLWFLREEMSRSGEIIYCKWYKGRATLFSKELFTNLISALHSHELEKRLQQKSARTLYDILEDNSPLSTKELKRETDLVGKVFEGEFQRGMKELWSRGLIVAFGERDDGAFPSLLVGASKLLFEDLWREAQSLDPAEAWSFLEQKLAPSNPFFKEAQRQHKQLRLLS